MRRTLALLAIPAALAVALAAASAPAAPAPAPSADGVPVFGHVFVLMGENSGLDKLTPARSPYLTQNLRPRSAYLTRYTGVTLGGSLANYMGMIAGRYTRCDLNDDVPSPRCSHPWDNLFSQLTAKGDSWRQWSESADNACDIVDHGAAFSSNIYTVHHQPALYLTKVHGKGYDEAITPSRACRQDTPAMGSTAPNDTSAFDAALKRGRVGRFNLVVPNDCEDGHDPCAPVNDGVTQFDRFLAREVPRIEASPAFGSDGVIVITYDSGTSPKHKQILFDVLGPLVKPGTYATGPFDHYSFLRTMEDGFGITTHVANAARAQPIVGIWR